jgi:hypothetical protein
VKVKGVLLVDTGAPSFEDGRAEIAIEDVRRAGAAAASIAGTSIGGVSHRRGRSERIDFVIDCPEPPAGQHWSVRASLDQPGRGQFTTDRVRIAADTCEVVLQLRAVSEARQ